MAPERTIERLSRYRRRLAELDAGRERYIFSHKLAAICQVTAAQVRRDMMTIGFSGTPSRGYHVAELIEHIDTYIDAPEGTAVAVVGVGNLGRALLAFFHGRRPKLRLAAAFDSDPAKANRVTHGVRCYPLHDLERIITERGITVAIVSVPASQAQPVADRLTAAGVRGLLNFAPVALRTPVETYTANIDITQALEKVAYFARQRPGSRPEDDR